MESFQRIVKFMVNNGDKVWFWTDPWYSQVHLCRLFGGFFCLAEKKDGSVR